MCIIAVCEKRKLTEDEFDSCWWINDDGFGVAFPLGKKGVEFHKGFMEKDEAKAFYFGDDNQIPLPHVCHFRAVSAGKRCQQLTHPFIVSGNSEPELDYRGEGPIVFHNGTISGWEGIVFTMALFGMMPSGPMSDTRMLAIALSKVPDIYQFLNLFDGRFVVMSKGKITKYGTFVEEGGIFFSNYTFRNQGYKYSYYSTKHNEDRTDVWKNSGITKTASSTTTTTPTIPLFPRTSVSAVTPPTNGGIRGMSMSGHRRGSE